ncbi:outer membrane protein assembly factor BamE [Pseudorhodobacter sp. MZDSW-24AT]|uniref:outer membrane protein assembly factor BamE n=1 Tax=Pseudorhodobacter sp. MZDSW-24AT TaxID=2052957 RepID=UPI000C1E0854|nr:outer membrane protein assembly factor BamE [Pseudorhodobacter sp. MZDSW-24AT]PJF10909.1 outer membrane protein assembly factor BamE [Pseudorhodobacter sp. MZDSW-24AT]
MASTSVQRDRKPADASRGGLRRALIGVGLALTLTACAPIIRNHGYVPAEEDLSQLVVGQDTRETAGTKVGRPSTSGLLNDTGWFYVQSRWEQRGAFAPQEMDRQVVALTFSDSGVLQNVERFGIERGQIVPLSRRVTESSVKGQSVLAQLFSSFGRLSAGQLLSE